MGVSINIGGGFTGILTIVFITLKLLDKIDWSWWWVLAPLWLPITIVIAFVIAVLLIVLLIGLICLVFSIKK